MSLRTILSNYGFVFQRELFPALEEELGPLGARYELFITVLGFVQVEQFLTCLRGLPGPPQEDRAALARAFMTLNKVRHEAPPAFRKALPSRLHEALIDKTLRDHLVVPGYKSNGSKIQLCRNRLGGEAHV